MLTQSLTIAENPTRDGVGAFGLLMTGLPKGILLDVGEAMQVVAAATTGGGNGDRSKSCSERRRASCIA
jgi:hypothetical protein